MYTYVYTYKCIRIYTYMHIHKICACIYACIYMCIYTYVYICIHMYTYVYICICIYVYICIFCARLIYTSYTYEYIYMYTHVYLPKDGEIALWSATNRWYVVKCVSQKRNQSNNKTQWYNILVTFIFKFSSGQYETKIYLLSNLSNCRFTTGQY